MNIECTISTPQFKNGTVDYHKEQKGMFDIKTFLFTTIEHDGHNVQFYSEQQFEHFRISKKKQ